MLLGIISGNTCVHYMRWPKPGAELWLKRCYSVPAGGSTQIVQSFSSYSRHVWRYRYPRQIRLSPHMHLHFFLCKFSGSYSLLFPSVCPGCTKSLNYRNPARAKEVPILMYCFTRSGSAKRYVERRAVGSVEIQCRGLRWHFTSRDPLPGPAAADPLFRAEPGHRLVT